METLHAISRRDCLRALLAAGAWSMMGARAATASPMLHRPIPRGNETLPVIGLAPGCERVFFAGGWCGHGIALGILSGRWVQQLIDTGRPPENLPWFRSQPPLAPPDPLRWLAARAAGWAMEAMDRF